MATCFDAVLSVKVTHSNKHVAETIWRHHYFYKMGTDLALCRPLERAISTFFAIV
jgi:hypothetical protein